MKKNICRILILNIFIILAIFLYNCNVYGETENTDEEQVVSVISIRGKELIKSESFWGDFRDAATAVKDWVTRTVDCVKFVFANFITAIGDFFQIIANCVEMSGGGNGFVLHWATFTPSQLTSGGEYHNIADGYTRFADNGSSVSAATEKNIKITTADYAVESFKNARIPVIAVDYYTLAANRVKGTDANFLDPNGSGGVAHSNAWKILRNFIVNIIYVLMYVAAACIIMSLIWHGITIVKSSFSSPEQRKRHVEGLQKFVIAIGMYVGVIVVSAIFVYVSEMFLDSTGLSKTTDELPIRIHVEETGYSFSTTPTGYYRYLAEIENLDYVDEKITDAFWYTLLAFSNLALWIVMFVRMVLMMFLAAVGFVMVIMYIFGRDNLKKYTNWLKWYALIGSMQLILAFANRLLIETIPD